MGGAIEEGTKVATSVIEKMGSQPVCLALLVICAALVGLRFYEADQAYKGRAVLFESILKEQHNVQELLSKCVIPEK